jgi:MerR family transcriptional regulator, repressor of the yfmOP operon
VSHLDAATTPAAPLLRIQEVAAEVGLTSRTIRYYEELGLLEPAGRSEGSYRLYDPDDLDRLRFIKGLRDDAGFSLTEIGQLLEDEIARTRNRERFRETEDPDERRSIIADAVGRIDRQVATLRQKIERLESMVGEAEVRRAHLEGHRAELDAGVEPTILDPLPTPHSTRTRP